MSFVTWLLELFGIYGPARPTPHAFVTGTEAGTWHGRLMMLLEQTGADDPARADEAARALRDLVREYDARQWVRTDEVLRNWLLIYHQARTPAWLSSKHLDVRTLRVPADAQAEVLGLLGAHASGYVREAVVQRLARIDGGDELPPLLIRANDWVAQVRGRAVDALRARLVPAYTGAWVRWLPLVLRLGGPAREDVRPLVDGAMALLRSPEAADAVWAGLRSPDRVARRTCFGILEGIGGAGLRRLVDESLQSDDVVLHRGAVRVAGALDDASLPAVLSRLMADPAPWVRHDALALAAGRSPANALRWAREALLDRAAGVRAEARGIVQRLAPMDLAAFYRGHVLAGGTRLAPAVAGLAETGRPEDVALVRPLLVHASPRVRAAAVRALGRLGGASEAAVLLHPVGDAQPSVSRAAATALRDAVRGIDVGRIAALYRGSTTAHVRRNALLLLVAHGKWEGIPWILRALKDPDARVRMHARTYLHRWRQRFNRVSSQPAPDHLRELRDALTVAADALDAEMRDWLRFAAGIPR
jgi:hypothetical protein